MKKINKYYIPELTDFIPDITYETLYQKHRLDFSNGMPEMVPVSDKKEWHTDKIIDGLVHSICHITKHMREGTFRVKKLCIDDFVELDFDIKKENNGIYTLTGYQDQRGLLVRALWQPITSWLVVENSSGTLYAGECLNTWELNFIIKRLKVIKQ